MIGVAPRRSPNTWSVGDRVLAQADDYVYFVDDESEHWLPATIVAVHPWVRVHFDGYSRKWPHVVHWDEIRPCPIQGPALGGQGIGSEKA